MKSALIGLGAIGTVIAADLAKNDFPLYVVCKHQEVLDLVRSRGLKVTGISGEYIVKENLTPVLQIEDLPDDLDLVFIVTKLNHLEDALKRIKPKLSKDFTLVTMTNGMIEEKLSESLNPENLVGCVVSFGASKKGPAESNKTSLGEMVYGRMDGQKQKNDDEIIEKLSFTVPTKWSNNILNDKFSKLLINLSVASFGVISGMTLGAMLQRKITRIAFLTIITEGIQVANAKNIKLQKLNNLSFYSLAISKKELHGFSFSYFFKQSIIKIIGRKYKNLKSSSLQSIEWGRKSEIDYLNGYLVQEGKRLGIDTPLNKYLLETVHEIEEGKKKPSFEGLEDLERKTKEIWGLK
ncbi:MAG: 2-dehydropantoate 2-reductase [Candidatus Heimdallarchaeota archaeon]|nr:2-dehydropantoate 2-reductase [Candidatus Heimdallarchaeota archaeon]